MKDKIQTYVQLFKGDVQLTLLVDKKLKATSEYIKNLGYFEITNGTLNDKHLFLGNLLFFTEVDNISLLKEISEDLKEKGYKPKEILKHIKSLLKRAKKLKILS